MPRTVAALAFAALLSVTAATAQDAWQIDPMHTAAQFSVRHMGISTVRGAFTKVSGSANYNPSDLSKTSVDVTIDAASIDTRVSMRDQDLRSPNFFDVQKFPNITFKSKRVEPAGTGKMKITGDLTMHGVTKEAVLDVDGPTAPMTDPRGAMHMGASATTKVNRKDFGINGAPSMAGDEIQITLDVEMVKPAAAK